MREITLKCPCCKVKYKTCDKRFEFYTTVNGLAYEKCEGCRSYYSKFNTKNMPIKYPNVVGRQAYKKAQLQMETDEKMY